MKRKMLAMLLAVITVLTTMTVPAMAATPAIQKTAYKGSGVVEVDFKRDVQYKGAKVLVKDTAGKYYTAKITENDSDSVEIYVKGLKKGKKYAVQISGVRLKGKGSYTKVSKTFTAR